MRISHTNKAMQIGQHLRAARSAGSHLPADSKLPGWRVLPSAQCASRWACRCPCHKPLLPPSPTAAAATAGQSLRYGSAHMSCCNLKRWVCCSIAWCRWLALSCLQAAEACTAVLAHSINGSLHSTIPQTHPSHLHTPVHRSRLCTACCLKLHTSTALHPRHKSTPSPAPGDQASRHISHKPH